MAKVGRPLNSHSSGTYVCALPDAESKKKLARLASVLGHPLTPESIDELHSTVMYAKGAFPTAVRFPRSLFGAKVSGIEFWSGHDNDGYVVATLDSPDLKAEHRRWVARGLSHSFEDYSPHVTLFSKVEKTEDLIAHVNSVSPRAVGMLLTFDEIQIEGMKPNA